LIVADDPRSLGAAAQCGSGITRLIVGAGPRTFEQLVNAQPLTCRRHLLVP